MHMYARIAAPLPTRPDIATGIDFGRYGLAHCTADVSRYPPVIKDVTIEPDIGLCNTPPKAINSMMAFLHKLESDPVVGTTSLYLLEQQPIINKKTCMMECAFGAAAENGPRSASTKTMHIPVSAVKREFDLPSGYREKKRAAERIALKLLTNPAQTIIESEQVKKSMLDSKRRHDMADAMLMVMWHARVKHGRLVHELTKSSNRLLASAKQRKQRKKPKKTKK